jgi:hypothetical protein
MAILGSGLAGAVSGTEAEEVMMGQSLKVVGCAAVARQAGENKSAEQRALARKAGNSRFPNPDNRTWHEAIVKSRSAQVLCANQLKVPI